MQGGFFMLNCSMVFAAIVTKSPDGGYDVTGTGKVVLIAGAILLVLLNIVIYNVFLRKKAGDDDKAAGENGKLSPKKKSVLGTKELVVSAVCISAAYVLSFFKIPFFSGLLIWGGSVTPFSMFFITYIGYCFGLRAGLLSGLSYGILQFIQEPWFLNPLQLFFDYLFAFSALGFSAVFRNAKTKDASTGEKRLTKKGLIAGFVLGAVLRGISHTIGGYLFWMDYMPDSFPKKLSFLYPIAYNFSYIGIETVMTVIVLLVPGVARVFIRLRREANR